MSGQKEHTAVPTRKGEKVAKGGAARPWREFALRRGRRFRPVLRPAQRTGMAAQEQLMIRAKANSEAQRGIYAGSAAGGAAAAASLHQKNYTY